MQAITTHHHLLSTFFVYFKHCQDIPLRQLLRRGSDTERPTAVETVRFEDLKLGEIPWE